MSQRRPGAPGRRCAVWIVALLVALPVTVQGNPEDGARGTTAQESQGWRQLAAQVRRLAEEGQWPQALRTSQQALKSAQQDQDADQMAVAELVQTIAWLHRSQGRYREAEQHAQDALATFERVAGQLHPAVASCLNEVGLNLAFLGRYREAETRLRRAVSILDQTSRPPLSSYVNSLGFVVEAQGRYDEAAQHYQRALTIVEQTLGPDHLHAAIALSNLANLARIQGRHDKAEALYERALAIRGKRAGQPASGLAVHVADVERIGAVAWGSRASAAAQRLLPEQAEEPVEASPALLAMTALAGVKTGMDEEPRREGAGLISRIAGDHADARTLNGLGALYLSQGRGREAEPVLRQALIRLEASWGPEHPDVANVVNNLGVAARMKNEFSQAEAFYQRAQDIWTNSLGKDHAVVAKARTNRADAAAARVAEKPHAPATSRKRAEALAAMSASMNRRAKIYMELGEHAAAEELLQGSLAIFERHFLVDDPAVAPTLTQYIELLHKVGRHDEAKTWQAKLDAISPPK